jgi:hypothetical protein
MAIEKVPIVSFFRFSGDGVQRFLVCMAIACTENFAVRLALNNLVTNRAFTLTAALDWSSIKSRRLAFVAKGYVKFVQRKINFFKDP